MLMNNTLFLKEKNEVHGGIQHIYTFPNGYGASVIKHKGSYGYAQDKWEIAPLDNNGDFIGQSIFGWFDDVKGHLNDPQVDAILKDISNLEVPVDA